jgi:hypothetical protein
MYNVFVYDIIFVFGSFLPYLNIGFNLIVLLLVTAIFTTHIAAMTSTAIQYNFLKQPGQDLHCFSQPNCMRYIHFHFFQRYLDDDSVVHCRYVGDFQQPHTSTPYCPPAKWKINNRERIINSRFICISSLLTISI